MKNGGTTNGRDAIARPMRLIQSWKINVLSLHCIQNRAYHAYSEKIAWKKFSQFCSNRTFSSLNLATEASSVEGHVRAQNSKIALKWNNHFCCYMAAIIL